MAGDWIKVEVTTPDKLEVAGMAHRLGITPEEVFGRLFRVWAWCQNVSLDGHFPVPDLSPVDRAAGLSGFGQAMAEVGWLTPEKKGFSVPRWDRHLSKGAKKRALEREKKRGQRANSVPDSVPKKKGQSRDQSVENRGTSSPSEKKARSPSRTPKCRMPEELTPAFVETDAEIQCWNEGKGFDPKHLLLHFEYFQLAVAKTDLMYAGMKGWKAAFKKAVAEDWAGIRKPKEGGKTDRWLDELTGGRHRTLEGDTLEGTAERCD